MTLLYRWGQFSWLLNTKCVILLRTEVVSDRHSGGIYGIVFFTSSKVAWRSNRYENIRNLIHVLPDLGYETTTQSSFINSILPKFCPFDKISFLRYNYFENQRKIRGFQLFNEREFIMAKRKKITQLEVVKRHLQSGKTLTSLQAFKKWGITRLSGVIYKLRNLCEMDIRSEYINVSTRWEHATVARYSL